MMQLILSRSVATCNSCSGMTIAVVQICNYVSFHRSWAYQQHPLIAHALYMYCEPDHLMCTYLQMRLQFGHGVGVRSLLGPSLYPVWTMRCCCQLQQYTVHMSGKLFLAAAMLISAVLCKAPFNLHPALIRIIMSGCVLGASAINLGYNAPSVQHCERFTKVPEEGCTSDTDATRLAVTTCYSTCNAVLMPHYLGFNCACLALRQISCSALFNALFSLS